MNFKMKFLMIFTLMLAINFSPNFAKGVDDSKSFFELKMGKISKIDYALKKISLGNLEGLKISESTINVDRTLKRVADDGRLKKIKDLHEGLGLMVRYNISDKDIADLWVLHKLDEEFDLMNFIYIQEKKKDK